MTIRAEFLIKRPGKFAGVLEKPAQMIVNAKAIISPLIILQVFFVDRSFVPPCSFHSSAVFWRKSRFKMLLKRKPGYCCFSMTNR